LLGLLEEQDEERIEVRLLSDPGYVEEFDIAVDELTDQYVAGEVQGKEREEMKQYFFASAERREKLKIAAALKQRTTEHSHKGRRWFHSPQLRIAASILIVFGLAFGLYRVITTRQSGSEFDKGLVALRTAYGEQRPIEARISELPHARFAETRRGATPDSSVQDQLRLAELHFAQALKDKPTPEAHHELGKVYLAQGKYDQALSQFQESLKSDQNDAQVYNDIGVAWLEKGDFNLSLDSLNKALALDGNSLDALFNRALVYDKLHRTDEAKTAWNEYLKRDSSSPWSEEAHRHLNSYNP
jgi:tetratricopeptide (TPR) repeat protein